MTTDVDDVAALQVDVACIMLPLFARLVPEFFSSAVRVVLRPAGVDVIVYGISVGDMADDSDGNVVREDLWQFSTQVLRRSSTRRYSHTRVGDSAVCRLR
eukprot:gene20147-24116_t